MLTINFIDEGNKYLLRHNLQCQAIAPVVYECIKKSPFQPFSHETISNENKEQGRNSVGDPWTLKIDTTTTSQY